MTLGRRTLVALLAGLAAQAGDFDRLAGRWRSRITVVRNGRPLYTRLRLLFTAAGGYSIEEYATGGQLVWIYKGAARLGKDGELFLDVASVTDPNGAAAEEGRARYRAGESYNMGAIEYVSAARVRVGSLELQKELD